ncbi:MAG: hypothetical protein Q4F10_12310 [Corynebacterium glutamicum]|nr:hypothetical protein [Corynebacterium glutamicum]
MTLVNIDIRNVASETHPDDRVVFYSPTLREAPGGGLVSTAEQVVPLVDGVGEIDLTPGPVTVTFQCRGISDTRPKSGTVPDTGPVDIADVIDNALVYSPEVVGAAQAAKNESVEAAREAQAFSEATLKAAQEAGASATEASASRNVAMAAQARAEAAAWKAELTTVGVNVVETPPLSGLWIIGADSLQITESEPDSGLYLIGAN